MIKRTVYLFGDRNTGKTSLVKRWKQQGFDERYRPTKQPRNYSVSAFVHDKNIAVKVEEWNEQMFINKQEENQDEQHQDEHGSNCS